MNNILNIETNDDNGFSIPFNPEGILVWSNVENIPIHRISISPMEDKK